MSQVTTGVIGGLFDDESNSSALTQKTSEQSPKRGDLRVKRVELVVRCQELSRFLRGFDEQPWATWLEECVAIVRQDCLEGVDTLLGSFHGIGALSDVYLCPEAGHSLTSRDENAINEQFLLMLSKVNNLAREIQKLELGSLRQVRHSRKVNFLSS